MLKATGGYDCVTISEDAEYYFNRLFDGYKGHFVEDAVIYEDMPSTYQDTLNRNKRIGSGSVSLLKPKFAKMFGKFFTTGELSYLEICLSYSFIFLTVLLAIWIPLFFVYDFLYLGFVSYGYIPVTWQPVEWYYTIFWNTIIIGGSILLGLFIIFGFLQAFILVMTDYKKLGAEKRSEVIKAAFFFPFYLAVYVVTICAGTMSKPTWGRATET